MSFKLSHTQTMNAVIGYVKEKRPDVFIADTPEAIAPAIETNKFKKIWSNFAPSFGAPNGVPAVVLEKIASGWGKVDLRKWPLNSAMDVQEMEMPSFDPSRPNNVANASEVVVNAELVAEQHHIRVETLHDLIVELDRAKSAKDALFALVTGDAGFGKSFTVLDALSRLENVKFDVQQGGVMTDIALFELFAANSDENSIILLDDVTLSMSKTCMNILKGALQTKPHLRTIEWSTVDGVRKVLFQGSLIWLSNERLSSVRANKMASLNAVLSRFPVVIDLSIPLVARKPLVKAAIANGLLDGMGLNLGYESTQAETITEILIEKIDAAKPEVVNFRFVENMLRMAERTLRFDEVGLISESLDKFETRMSVNQAITIS